MVFAMDGMVGRIEIYCIFKAILKKRKEFKRMYTDDTGFDFRIYL